MSEKYNDSSITQLKGAERVRKRPGVMFGSDDKRGAFHTLKEIIGNSLDESRAGYGKKIDVVWYEDGSISVRDYGRGVPMGYNDKEQAWNWHLIFNELYAGGKYDEADEDYEFSLGLNGLGAAAVQYTSEFFHVESYRGGKVFKKSFNGGYPLDENLTELPNTTGETGTFIHWKIDNAVFPDTEFNIKMFTSFLESQAHLNEVDLLMRDENTGMEYEFKGEGVEQYLKAQLGDKVIDVITKQRDDNGVERGVNYKSKIDLVLAITDETSSKQLHFHNTATMNRGVHLTAYQSAIERFFKDIAKQNNVKITPYDYQDYLSVLTSTYSNITSFANQTKDGVSNTFISNLVYEAVLDLLEESYAMKRESITTLINNVVTAALARKKAKEIEVLERQVNKATGNSRKVTAEKLLDCTPGNPEEKELFIVEGDSAKGACKDARDGSFQALLPIKGKISNGLKTPLKKLLENQEVKDIMNTLGTGIDVDWGDLFDISKLKYGKIIITTDADVDGYQIRVLLYTVIYRLFPKLLEEGRVYVAETPLFTLETNKGDKFAYDMEEYNNMLEAFKADGTIVKKVKRSKGLGENDADMLWDTTMNPATRRIVPLTIDIKSQIVRDVTNMLFGNDPHNERKGFVFSMLETSIEEDMDLNDLVDTIEMLTDSEEETELVEA